MMAIQQNSDGLLTSDDTWWINAHINPPSYGRKVRVLSRDGIDCGATAWTKDSIRYFDGWLPFARIPPDIKALQVGRYLAKWPEALSEKEK